MENTDKIRGVVLMSDFLTNDQIELDSGSYEENINGDGQLALSWRSTDNFCIGAGMIASVYNGVVTIGGGEQEGALNYYMREPYIPSDNGDGTFTFSPTFVSTDSLIGKSAFYLMVNFAPLPGESGGVGEAVPILTFPYNGYAGTLASQITSVTGLEIDLESSLSHIGVNISFDNDTGMSAAQKLADNLGASLVIVGGQVRIGYNNTLAVNESYDYFFVYGGTRNMAKRAVTGEGMYAAVTRRLTLPSTYPFSIMDSSGNAISPNVEGEAITAIKGAPTKTLIFDDIYPKMELQIGTVVSRVAYLLDEDGNHIIDHYEKNGQVVDPGTDGATPVFKYYTKYYVTLAFGGEGYKPEAGSTQAGVYELDTSTVIQGKPLGILFQSGILMGREFDLAYYTENTTEREADDVDESGFDAEAGMFRIVMQADGTTLLPNSTLCPSAGDKVTLTGVALQPEYTDIAKRELEAAAKEMIGYYNQSGSGTAEYVSQNVNVVKDFLTGEEVQTSNRSAGNDGAGGSYGGYTITSVTVDLVTGNKSMRFGTFQPKGLVSSMVDALEGVSLKGGGTYIGGSDDGGYERNTAPLGQDQFETMFRMFGIPQLKTVKERIIEEATVDLGELEDEFEEALQQNDRNFKVFYGTYNPLPTLVTPDATNYPASSWPEADYKEHVKDIFVNRSNDTAWQWTSVKIEGTVVYRFRATKPNTPTGTTVPPTGWLAEKPVTSGDVQITFGNEWQPDEDDYYISPQINHGELTYLTIHVNTPFPINVLMDVEVSSEKDFDFAFVTELDISPNEINNEDNWQDSWSGEEGLSIEYNIRTAGSHTFYFGYRKDTGESEGDDMAKVQIYGFSKIPLWYSVLENNVWSEPQKYIPYYWKDITDDGTAQMILDINDIASDDRISGGTEKTKLRMEWQNLLDNLGTNWNLLKQYNVTNVRQNYLRSIAALWNIMNDSANELSVTLDYAPNSQEKCLFAARTTYTVANWLQNYPTTGSVPIPLWIKDANMNTTSVVSNSTTYRTAWETYYKRLSEVEQAISNAMKANGDEAMQILGNIANDDVLTVIEKQEVLRRWQDITEEFKDFTARTTRVHLQDNIVYSNYKNAYEALGTYMNDGTWTTDSIDTLPAWLGTYINRQEPSTTPANFSGSDFTALWNNYYEYRSELNTAINTISNTWFVGDDVPEPPYYVGDFWLKTVNGDLATGTMMICIYSRDANDTPDISDWMDYSEFSRNPLAAVAALVEAYLMGHPTFGANPGDSASLGSSYDVSVGAEEYTQAYGNVEALLGQGTSISLSSSLPNSNVNAYDAAAVRLVYTDATQNAPIVGGHSIYVYDGEKWCLMVSSTTAAIQNLGNAIRLVVFGSEGTTMESSGLLTTQNFIELFSKVSTLDTLEEQIIAQALLRLGIVYKDGGGNGDEVIYVNNTWVKASDGTTSASGEVKAVSIGGMSADLLDFQGKNINMSAANTINLNAGTLNLNADKINWKQNSDGFSGDVIPGASSSDPVKFHVDPNGDVTMNNLTALNGTFEGTVRADSFYHKVQYLDDTTQIANGTQIAVIPPGVSSVSLPTVSLQDAGSILEIYSYSSNATISGNMAHIGGSSIGMIQANSGYKCKFWCDGTNWKALEINVKTYS